MIRKVSVLIAVVALAASFGMAYGPQEPGAAPKSNISVVDYDGNLFDFEQVSHQGRNGVAEPFTRVTLTRAGDGQTFVREYAGIFHSPLVGSRGVYAVRAVLPSYEGAEPPTPAVTVVAVCARGAGLPQELPGMAISLAETVKVVAGAADTVYLVNREFAAPGAESESAAVAPGPGSVRSFTFDGAGFSETGSVQ